MAGEKTFEAQEWGCRVEVVIRSIQWRSGKSLSLWAGHSSVGVTDQVKKQVLKDLGQMHCTVRNLPVSAQCFVPGTLALG